MKLQRASCIGGREGNGCALQWALIDVIEKLEIA
jgi:hypothetical protein